MAQKTSIMQENKDITQKAVKYFIIQKSVEFLYLFAGIGLILMLGDIGCYYYGDLEGSGCNLIDKIYNGILGIMILAGVLLIIFSFFLVIKSFIISNWEKAWNRAEEEVNNQSKGGKKI